MSSALAQARCACTATSTMQAFYGMDLAEAIAAAPSSFGGYQKIDTAAFFE